MDASRTELLAPAGQPEAGYAALHYGADAVYLGLNRFSARAEAVNFTPDQLGEFVAYAHSLVPKRRVYLTLNTVVKQSELAGAAETLFIAAECSVDAVIVQDLGVARLARERFPRLHLHASTQMAIHNLEGAKAAGELGYRRVTLARELTLAELADIAANSGLEVEAFIHGTLCYSYSGLCMFSSMVAGRSGNRGRCNYACREAIRGRGNPVHPFSLKDLALGERVRDLAAAGVSSLKIEGRKKSPLYVGATVAYYRKLLDNTISPREMRETEANLRTIFARPWTRFFLDGRHNPDAADPEVVGHRGARVGAIAATVRTPAGPGILFSPDMAVERHDGLQVDVPGQSKPFGFPVDNLYLADGKKRRSVFAAPAGATVVVALPADAPELRPGYPLYLSSSQAVKRSYPFSMPKPGEYSPTLGLSVSLLLDSARDGEDGVLCRVHCLCEADAPWYLAESAEEPGKTLVFSLEETVPAFVARDASGAEAAARTAFERTGGSRFRLERWRFDNEQGFYVKPGDWNRLRRAMMDGLTKEYEKRVAAAKQEFAAAFASPKAEPAPVRTDVGARWSVFADRHEYLEHFSDEDFVDCAEIVVGLHPETGDASLAAIESFAEKAGREKIRFAVPLLLRGGETSSICENIRSLHDKGWRRWMVSNVAGWNMVSRLPGLDVSADWPLYALNSLSWQQLAAMGFSSFTFSPEDGRGNLEQLAPCVGDNGWLVVFSDIPLFLSAACAHGHLGLCRGKNQGEPWAACPERGKRMAVTLERSGAVDIWARACGSTVTASVPYSLSGVLPKVSAMGIKNLRVELRWKPYRPDEAVAIWRRTRSGRQEGIVGNFERGLL